ncbi:hypothetical protein ERJ75_001630400 [Trypanosoma vivax]|nr:hypothetical protein ERJ75_001630400 [Trypanosoma vivax]
MCPATWCQAPRARTAEEQARKRRRRFSAVRRPATCTHQLPAAVRRGSDWQGGVVTRRWSGGLIAEVPGRGLGRFLCEEPAEATGSAEGRACSDRIGLGHEGNTVGARRSRAAGGSESRRGHLGVRGNALQGGRSLGCFSWRCACCTGHLRAARAWMGPASAED